ncbi:MAG TPA: carboxyl transferase domain-containing protein [Caulobacteraceae bacterium]|nr:carboxyl transferase domain-containing protein [Caulobacteraceae bacterium]
MFKKILVANRGEIAIRIARTAAEMGVASVAVFPADDAPSLHVKAADEAWPLEGAGAGAYLDGAQILAAAKACACEAIHPGYGFLSENAAFARMCAEAGVVFIGPAPEALELFGDKTAARRLAIRCGIPVLAGSHGPVTKEQAKAFFAELGDGGALMLKAVAGGGGRGMRAVTRVEDLEAAFDRSSSEALKAFGSGDVYVERLMPSARHVEAQILGDGAEAVHLWDRECSLQRQRQKLVETAPALSVAEDVREALLEAATRLAQAAKYRGLGTIEFLVDSRRHEGAEFVFIEANARLQVEHTVTEEVTGLDLVRLQLEIAGGRTLHDLGLEQAQVPAPRGVAIQARVNLETMGKDGAARPTGGTLSAYSAPSGPGVRVDGFGYAGYRTSLRYDSLLAKLIVHAPDMHAAARKLGRALGEFAITGPATNIPFLQALIARADFAAGAVDTGYVERNIEALLAEAAAQAPAPEGPQSSSRKTAGAKIDALDPLAVLAHGKSGDAASAALAEPEPPAELEGPPGTTPLRAPLQGTIVQISVEPGQAVRAGESALIMESMKMEHVIEAPVSGHVREIGVAVGDTVFEGHGLIFFEEADLGEAGAAEHTAVDLDHIRPDLAAVVERHRLALDEARPAAVERRRKTGQRTTRENVDDLLDPGSFVEYGPLVVAARRRRNTLEELIAQTPADGMVMGLGRVNGQHFADEAARVAVMAYDYTVLAGTQGAHNHQKMDRLMEIATRWRLPTVFFCEGGGGRPGDTEGGGFIRGFELWGRMSGTAPMVGITSGRCFAGNASVLGCCDVIIATKDSSIGMGGPAMIEGGGLGIFRPEEIGPVSVQEPNGVIDVLADDEAHAVALAKKYLSYFQGPLKDWTAPDQRRLRAVIPENRLRVYDVRTLIDILADEGSVLEIRPKFGQTMVAALIRIEGRPLGLIANNPRFLGGAIDSDGSDKAARFLQLCEAFDLPVLSLSDTPGMMVGPEIEKTALVRHCSRLFIIGANLSVPLLSVILRKSYGLGAIAMTGGSYQASMFAVSWPTGEYGGMGLEGSVKLGYRNELAAIADPAERRARFDEMVARAYEAGKALNRATGFGIDDVIDPADTRAWIMGALRSLPPVPPRTEKKLRWIDAW